MTLFALRVIGPAEKKFTEKIKSRWRNRGGKNRAIYAIAESAKKNEKFLKVAGGGPIPEGTVVDAVGK
ncbi:histidine kinase [Serratia ficaria]|uniref:histidine kinase n=1 Tax=Serratia ficaria TaxID=61651 RepID=UPI0021C6A9ED|nr:histidine kinase [Serratia ficaria]